MFFIKRTIAGFFVFFLLCCSIFAADLDIRFFKVGQANFVLLTKGTNALVVDCGVGSAYGDSGVGVFRNFNASYTPDIKSSLENIALCKIISTHYHGDHYGSIGHFLELIGHINRHKEKPILIVSESGQLVKLNCRNVVPISEGEITTECTLNPETTNKLWFAGWSNKSEVEKFLGCGISELKFFNDVTFTVLNPDNLPDTLLNPEDVHQNNLVLKITYQGESILLPGDANGALFSHHCLNTDNFFKLFADVAILLLPHHGSWGNGEQFWFEAFLKHSTQKNKLSIVSSDPRYDNCLPRYEFINKIWNRLDDNITLPHDVSASEIIIEQEAEVLSQNTTDQSKEEYYSEQIVTIMERQGRKLHQDMDATKCLFVTSDAKSNFYKITITSSGQVEVYDGDQLLYPKEQ